jgi:beta-phosphoglucomutase
VQYELQHGLPLNVRHNGASLELSQGAPTRLPLAPPSVRPVPRLPVRPTGAVIFDLDGVLVDTATLHYQAWKRLTDELEIPFDEQVNERLKGVDRKRSLEIILERAPRAFSAATRQELAARKNAYFQQLIVALNPQDLFRGARETLLAVRRRDVRVALASASHNAAALIERLGIAPLFDHVVDPTMIARGKPAPDIFLAAAAALGVDSAACIAVEDAAAGIEAILSAGMFAIGVGDRATLSAANVVVPNIASLTIEAYLSGALPAAPHDRRFRGQLSQPPQNAGRSG